MARERSDVQAGKTRAAPAEGDDALMARVARRDSRAFRVLVETHAGALHRIAYRMLADPVEAEDVAQEAMLRLWDHAGRWQAGGPGARAWLTRVAMNLCLDRLRRKRFISDEAVPERADSAPLADDVFDTERMRQATIACIGALPENQRAAIVLTYYEELPNIMAAATLDMKIKAFESLLLRARKGLRSALAERGLMHGTREGHAA